MKILVVHEVSYMRKVIYEIHEFPELLALRGHEITFMDFDEGASKATLSEPRDRVIPGRIHKEARIRLVTPHRFGLPSVDRLWAIFSCIPLLIRLFSSTKFDAVLNFAVPTYAIQVNAIAKLFGVPVMHRALDVSSKIRESAWNPLIYWYEFLAFLIPTKLSANNPAMEKYLLSRLPKYKHQAITVHYPPLDTEIFRPVKKDPRLMADLGISNDSQVLIYMGSFFYFSGLDEVIQELAVDLRSNPRLKILLIGGGEQEAELRKMVKANKLDSQVIFTGLVPFHELSRYMALGEIAINPLKNSLVAGAAFPHKVLQYMATGIPTVSTKLDGLYAAFGDNSGLIWASNPTELARLALDLLRQDGEIRQSQVELQLTTIKLKFSTKATVDALELSLQEMSNARKK